MITLHTNHGDIVIELDFDNAPISANNFLQYCRDEFYAGTIFHRVIPGFMIQGGGMNEDMSEKSTREPIKNEADNGLSNDTGTLAMARTMVPDSASSQFFINIADNHFLNHTAPTAQGWGYAVFGKVVDGMAVVDKIKTVETGNNGPHQDVPTETVVIEKTSISDAYAER
jgi:peptidyl-prolyl cis-trans isomerase B (cyclophilin B)